MLSVWPFDLFLGNDTQEELAVANNAFISSEHRRERSKFDLLTCNDKKLKCQKMFCCPT